MDSNMHFVGIRRIAVGVGLRGAAFAQATRSHSAGGRFARYSRMPDSGCHWEVYWHNQRSAGFGNCHSCSSLLRNSWNHEI
jgi:hypothetical protein